MPCMRRGELWASPYPISFHDYKVTSDSIVIALVIVIVTVTATVTVTVTVTVKVIVP